MAQDRLYYRGPILSKISHFSNLLQVRNDIPRRNSMPQSSRHYLGSSYNDLQTRGLDNDNEAPLLRVRSFTLTSKGIVNKGDSFRRGSTASILSTSSCKTDDTSQSADNSRPRLLSDASADSTGTGSFELGFSTSYHEVCVLGANGVGKTSLIKQFTTSDYIGSSDYENDNDAHSVFVYLDGNESTLEFIDQADGQIIPQILTNILLYFTEAKAIAEEYQCKYTETSVTLNHQVDELLVGILHQIRLKRNPENMEENITYSPLKQKNKKKLSLSSPKSFFNKLFGKGENRSKCCDNLYVT
ncbi:hypothetical protein KUTeg_019094 [Tegillarca granosa]|uniref:Uncharacterized protein n=1 Tax=Tegillarca granosa TaxID=220873 RepID=A0ABQ9EHG0_TEGGR|nr:hypothetical protein KUTeg_019094 [Tegillarca granosa]